jgi:hypothetical protein
MFLVLYLIFKRARSYVFNTQKVRKDIYTAVIIIIIIIIII